ncbi:hypothetical protein L228DRAFT_236115 [Xylona heveae TC161]|uniref:Uncharacterized protein n=1 Tax=Xylona heveae (strain CBS 132557 / TC161) TaxID=1328760 RepID=A0A165IJ46_XYLHT|nr:hypothetical protein L228DRAFT_236115 [Xylona heveae TC161]KZF24966.1 hypothetical protein L228DRAFT_236115 [Xylona heveae TC161]
MAMILGLMDGLLEGGERIELQATLATTKPRDELRTMPRFSTAFRSCLVDLRTEHRRLRRILYAAKWVRGQIEKEMKRIKYITEYRIVPSEECAPQNVFMSGTICPPTVIRPRATGGFTAVPSLCEIIIIMIHNKYLRKKVILIFPEDEIYDSFAVPMCCTPRVQFARSKFLLDDTWRDARARIATRTTGRRNGPSQNASLSGLPRQGGVFTALRGTKRLVDRAMLINV